RSLYAAILAVIGTVLADDPMLNARIDTEETHGGFLEGYDVTLPDPVHQPVRVIADAHLRIPMESNVVKSAREYRTIIVCAEAEEEKKRQLTEAGAEVLVLPGEDGEVSLTKLMEYLGENRIASVYIEGGGTIHEAAVRAGIVNRVSAYIGPKVFGGRDAKTPVEGSGFARVANSMQLRLTGLHRLGEDVWLEYEA
ncbi:MAG: RibD family protein, partial [Lachnospiraceae bacterium]|nr:RibD family protein [Lachnospiraceae bacterium]